MSDADGAEEDAPKKKSKLPLILGVVLALAGGGGGFFAVQSGLLFASEDPDAKHEKSEEAIAALPPISFVALDPLVVSLASGGPHTHLRFAAQLEVVPDYQSEVETLKPRIVDVLNGYLRAVDPAELADAQILARLRGQMLRRVQVVAGEGRVKDLLIMEFVLN